MTQHEYVFVAISIILGLAITRLLHTMGLLIRARRRVVFHWATVLWAICVMAYSLQFWWVGWELRNLETWTFSSFVLLTAGSIFVYGAAEMALPLPDGDDEPDFLTHSEGLGRLSALSMLLYFGVGPYVNIRLFDNDIVTSLVLPALGILLMSLVILFPKLFRIISISFAVYTGVILYLTA